MKKLFLSIFCFFVFGIGGSFAYTETIVDDQLANCFNNSMPIAVNQKFETGTGNIYFFCTSKYDHAARIYDETGNSIQTYGTGIYVSGVESYASSYMQLEFSFDYYSDHYDIITTAPLNYPTERSGYYIVKNGIIVNSFLNGNGKNITILGDNIIFAGALRYNFSTNTLYYGYISNTNPISYNKILGFDNIDTTSSTIIYYGNDGKYYQTKWDYNGSSYTATTREIFINKSSFLAIFPLETLSFPEDLNTYTGITLNKGKLQAYFLNDESGDDAVRYVLSLCQENNVFKFTTTTDHHYVSLTGVLPSYNFTDTIGFYNEKSLIYYDSIKNNNGIKTYIGIKEKPFLPLQYFCANNYGYSDFSNNIPSSVYYLNNNTAETYSLKKAVLNSGEKDTIGTIVGGGPSGTTQEEFNPNSSPTDTEITDDLFNFDINGDGDVSAWEYTLAPFTFLRNLVNKTLIMTQNFWKFIKVTLELGNIGIIPKASADGIGGAEFMSGFTSHLNGESGQEGFDDIAQKGKQVIFIILVLIVILFGFYSLRKN